MNAVLEKTVYQLTHVDNLPDVSVDDLLQLVNEHPYFAPAQLVLAARFQADGNSHFPGQLQKTALFFNNINWLDYLLQNDELKDVDIVVKSFRLPAVPSVKEDAVVLPEVEPVTDFVGNQKPDTLVITPSPAPAFAVPTMERVREIIQGVSVAPMPSAYEHVAPPIAETASEEEHQQFSLNESTIPSSLSEQLADFKKNFNKPVQKDMKLDFEVEPYYTIDYFASQGIKADLTQLPHDKLTRQLLTFTDWLKKMKAVSPDPQDLGTDPELENAIQGIAQTSNEAKEIATETMAEVFVKQGKIDKAVQLYIKLSFLDPEKSSYFASKIQQLKGI